MSRSPTRTQTFPHLASRISITLSILASFSISCFPKLPPLEDANDVELPDVATGDIDHDSADLPPIEDVEGVEADSASVDLIGPGDSNSNDADALGDIDQVAVSISNLPATVESPWGRPGSFDVEANATASPTFQMSDVTCSFAVNINAQGLVTWRCPRAVETCGVKVTARIANVEASAVLSIACVNTLPTIDNVTIEPLDPIPGDPLTCRIEGFDDPNGDPDHSIIVWFKNGSPVTGSEAPTATTVGDSWYCEVTPYDGLATGETITSEPIDVLSRFVDIAVGEEHTCVVHRRGKVYCWGENQVGQLGNLSTTPSEIPLKTSILTDAVSVAAGGIQTCALRADRSLMCWGGNQLFPNAITALGNGVDKVVVGTNHKCALKDGAVWCWGSNLLGQLGQPLETRASPIPILVSGLPAAVTDIDTTADFTCALAEGETWCWGRTRVPAPYADHMSSEYNTALRPEPFLLNAFPPTVTKLLVPSWRVCGLTPDAIVCDEPGAGGTNLFGHVADPSLFRDSGTEYGSGFRRIDVPSFNDIREVDAGDAICARSANGVVRCFGNDGQGLLGTMTRTLFSHLGDAIPLDLPASRIASGVRHSCAIAGDDVFCWGRTRSRRFEAASPVLSNSGPTTVQGLTAPRVLSLGHEHACAIDHEDNLYCWGRNDYNQLADYSNSSFAVPMLAVDEVTSVSAYAQSTLVLKDGALTQFGGEFDDFTGFPAPGYIGSGGDPVSWATVWTTYGWPNGTNVNIVSDAGYCGITPGTTPVLSSNCAFLQNFGGHPDSVAYRCELGGARCFVGRFSESNICVVNGYNDVFCGNQEFLLDGMLNGDVTHIASARGIACVVAGGSLHCFGRNNSGQLGRGTTSTQSQAAGLATTLTGTVTHASMSDEYGCAVMDGDVYCWGRNKGGRLGHADITLSQTITPRKIQGLAADTTRVITSQPDGTLSCALLIDGRVQCWGDNLWGQLGNGEAAYKRGPQRVEFPSSP